MNKKNRLESPFHISKRVDLPLWKKILTKVSAGLIALLLCGIVSQLVGGNIGIFFRELFLGNFGTSARILNLFEAVALLLIVSLAVTPAFKMRFWNIGAEGQVLMGALICFITSKFLGGKVPDALLIIISIICAIGGGAVWGAIPAIFKAKWNTNETLFTLMLNYIATGLILYVIKVLYPKGSGTAEYLRFGQLPTIAGYNYIINIIA